MAGNRYLALLGMSGKPVTEDQMLHQQILYFLDDRRRPVSVFYFDRFPSWVRRHPLCANIAYLLKLLVVPTSTVIVDHALHSQLAFALPLTRLLRRHRLMLLFRDDLLGSSRIRRPGGGNCLQAAHQILVKSQETWLQLCSLDQLGGKTVLLSQPKHGLPLRRSAVGRETVPRTSSVRMVDWPWRKLRRWKPFEVFLETDALTN